ncbi:hypothetical protein [Thiohalobacter sp.]|uniref:hypothetical protein n=1 Tax=Thiohalobacter sp. TaxID=2025948 RepID=UPI002615A29D|nr:hypothetical protein [Thiohalobacter sp.]
MNMEALSGEDLMAEDIALYGEDLIEDIDDEDDNEALETLAEFDDDDDEEDAEFIDDDDDESEEAEFLAPLLGMAIPGLVGGAVKGISRLLRPRSRRPRKFRRFTPVVSRGGIRGGIIRTPRGVARIRLPRTVTPLSVHRRDIARLNRRDNQLNARINRTQKDLARTDKKAAQALALAGTANTRVTRLARRHKRDLKKLKEDQSSSNMMNLMISMMQIQGINSSLANHTHGNGPAPDNPPQSNPAMMFLPLLLSDSGGDDDSMLMMVMMMTMNAG